MQHGVLATMIGLAVGGCGGDEEEKCDPHEELADCPECDRPACDEAYECRGACMAAHKDCIETCCPKGGGSGTCTQKCGEACSDTELVCNDPCPSLAVCNGCLE